MNGASCGLRHQQRPGIWASRTHARDVKLDPDPFGIDAASPAENRKQLRPHDSEEFEDPAADTALGLSDQSAEFQVLRFTEAANAIVELGDALASVPEEMRSSP